MTPLQAESRKPGAPVQVLLACYQGEAYLPELLASLDAQRDGRESVPFTVLARDDGSTDGTLDLLRAWRDRQPHRVRLLDDPAQTPDPPRAGSARGAFARLLEHADADYVMCCDQDDVWLPDKVATVHRRMIELEAELGRSTPILVHTDLTVVDQSLTVTAESMWTRQRLPARGEARLSRLLVQNIVTGCTTMANRALVDHARPIPGGAVMHDWWMALVAASLGRLDAIDRPTILYRQHASNDTGAKRYDLAHVRQWAGRILMGPGIRDRMRRTTAQAGALLDRCGDAMPGERRAVVEAYATLLDAGPIARRLRLARHDLWFHGKARNAGLLIGV